MGKIVSFRRPYCGRWVEGEGDSLLFRPSWGRIALIKARKSHGQPLLYPSSHADEMIKDCSRPYVGNYDSWKSMPL